MGFLRFEGIPSVQLTDRQTWENRFARRLGSLSVRHQAELIQLIGNPPDVTRVPSSFWEKVEREEREEMVKLLLLIFLAAAVQHGATRDAVESQAAQWASVTAARVAAERATTSREILARKGAEWREKIAEREREKLATEPEREKHKTGKPVLQGEITAAAQGIFGPTRGVSTVVTVTTQAEAAGSEFAVKTTGKESPDDRWLTERDGSVCPICRPLHLKKRDVWEAQFPDGPPAHPNCRCEIVYVNLSGARR